MAPAPGEPYRADGDRGLSLAVRLTPKASRDGIDGLGEFDGAPVLLARVRALPHAGEANQALCKLIAKWLKVPRSVVAIGAGGKSRIKRVLIEGEPSELAERLRAALADLAKP